MNSIFLFAPENLTMMLNLFLIGVSLLVIIYALFSMLRKALPQAFHFVFYLILVIGGIFLVSPTVKALTTMDLSSYNIVLTMNESQIEVNNIIDTVSNIIKLYAGNDETSFIYIALSDKDLNEFILSIAYIFVNYAVFLVYMILVMLLAKPLGALIYNLAFKWIFPKKIRKYKYKKRIKSFLIGLTKGSLAALLLLTPFTSLINSINKGIQQNKSTVVINQESYDEIITWVDAYNDSVMAKVAFDVSDGRSLDMVIMDVATSSDYQGEKLVFSDQLTTMADLLEKVLAAGLMEKNEDGTGIEIGALLSKEVITAIISSVTDSDFLMKLFPILINVVMTYAQETELFETEYLNVSDIDWKDELNAINNIYNSLYDAGIVTDLVDGGQFAIPFDDDSRLMIKDAFESLDGSKLLSRVIHAVIYSFVVMADEEGNPSELSNYLSTDWEDYEVVKWGHELGIIYDTLYQLDKIDIKLNINMGGEESQPEQPLEKFKFANGFFKNEAVDEENNENDEKADQILDQLMEKFDEIIVILTGLDENGQKVIEHQFETIFDSDFLMGSIDKLLPTLVDTLLNSGEESTPLINKDELVSALEKIVDVDGYKFETYSLLKICKDLVFNENFDLLNGTDANILDNQHFRDALVNVAPSIDNSIILSTCLPTVFETLLGDLSFGEEIPLSGKDFNFRNIKFATEIPILLEGYESIMNLTSSLGNTSSLDSFVNNLNPDDLANALKTLHKSKILNPGTENKNFYTLLDVIFNNESFKSMGIYPNEEPNYHLVNNWDNEIDAIANIFTNLKNESILGMLTGGFSLTSLEEQEIMQLFASIDDSVLLSGTFGNVMDNLVLSTLNISLDGVSFTNVDSWEQEGIAFADAITSFKKFGGDIGSIDWINSDPNLVEDLLVTFASMQLFDDGNEYYFDDYFHQMLVDSGALTDFLKDYPSNGEATYSQSKEDFESASWPHEITKIVGVIRALQNVNGVIDWNNPDSHSPTPGTDGINLLTGGGATSSQLQTIVDALVETDSFRLVTFNVINDMLKGSNSPLALDGVDLSVANTEYLLTCSKEERKNELNGIISSLELIDGKISSDSQIDITDLEVEELLLKFHDSYILNSLDFSKYENTSLPFTIFEQMVRYTLSQNGLKDYIVRPGSSIDTLIKNITNNYAGNSDKWTTEEIYNIQDIVDCFGELDCDFNESAIINLNKNLFTKIMKTINKCSLTQYAIVKFFEGASDKIGLTNFAPREEFHFDLYEESLGIANPVEAYNLEIDHMGDVIETAKIGQKDANNNEMLFDFGSSMKLQDLLAEGSGKSSTPFFRLLIESEIYKDVRASIIFNVIKSAGMDKYVREHPNGVLTSDENKIMLIDSFFDETKYDLNVDVEGACFDEIIHDLEHIDAISQTGSLKDFVDNQHLADSDDLGKDIISEIIMDTKLDEIDLEGNLIYHRAYFTSEIVAGIMDKTTKHDSHNLEWYRYDSVNDIISYPLLVNEVGAQVHDILLAYSYSLDIRDDNYVAFYNIMRELDSFAHLIDEDGLKDNYIDDAHSYLRVAEEMKVDFFDVSALGSLPYEDSYTNIAVLLLLAEGYTDYHFI